MSLAETLRTVSANNDIGAEVGDEVKFVLPDMVDIMASLKYNIFPLLVAVISYYLVANALKDQESTRYILSIAAMVVSYLAVKFIVNKVFDKGENDHKYGIKILEILGKSSPFDA